jgi:hypothetical protein
VTRRAPVALCAAASFALSACGGSSGSGSGGSGSGSSGTAGTARAARPAHARSGAGAHRRAAATTTTTTAAARRAPAPPSYPRLDPAATATAPTGFVPAVSWRGRTAVWVARTASVALLSFDQSLVTLRLHSGTVDAGPTGWRYGPASAGAERRTLIAAFNGGFKLDAGVGGFESYGRVGAALSAGLGSVVTYSDGTTDIGAWRAGVPAPGATVVSVRQNLRLLIDGGRTAATTGCVPCWGATLGGVAAPARSGLGVTADGRLIWAGGENLTADALAGALRGARVVRAVELDINPEWVAGYLYGHRGGRGPLAPVAVAPGQNGVPGQFLAPYSRDFFTVTGR